MSTNKMCEAISLAILLLVLGSPCSASLFSWKTENKIKTAVHLSPKIEIGPGAVSNKNYYDIDFPRGHVALKGFTAEVVDEAGNSVPLHETYLHHWALIRYRQSKSKLATHASYDPHRVLHVSDSIFESGVVRNSGICQGNVLGQYYGIGSETRGTNTDIPDPFGLEIGNPEEGYEEKWMLNIHAIDTRGVEDKLGCTECRCDLYNVTVNEFGKPLPPDYIGGLNCCYHETQCRLKKGFQGPKRSLYLRYTVKWIDWDEYVVPVKIYIIDVTDTLKISDTSSITSSDHDCRVEYEVDPCNRDTKKGNDCLDVKRTSLPFPKGGYVVYGVAHQHSFWQQHYVYPEEETFDFSSVHAFLSEFLNGTLYPYQRSGHVLKGQREATRPPFVNLDFHELDSIPRITTCTFSELVIGFNLSNKENASNAWNKDVLVLFSNSWCAFCQRMEMVVREVYLAIKDYANMLKSGSQDVKEGLDYVTLKLPEIYLLDCTLNDCDLILKSANQGEVYPALILFPAEIKKAILYQGDMAVIDIMKFVADHGSNFHNLIKEKVLWVSERVVKNQDLYDTLQTEIHEESLHKHSKYVAAPVHDNMVDEVVRPNVMNSPVSDGSHEALSQVMTGSVLIATEKLSGVQPFDRAKILIVAADQLTGFQGLIINKPIEWNVLPTLQEGFEKLKEAPLSFGGPVMQSGLPLSSLTTVSGGSSPEILPGIYFLDQVTTIRRIEELKSANKPADNYWFFLGFSSWGWDQLYHEMAAGAWNLSDDGVRHLNWP